MRILTTAALIALLPLSSFADAAQDAVQARQGFFKLLNANMGGLQAMAQGNAEYDEALAVSMANNLVHLSQLHVMPLFMEGTSTMDRDDTRALPEIWDDPAAFGEKFAGFGEAVANAPDAVRGGAANIAPVLQQAGLACRACHDDYRQP
ncbi:MAG: cytochrome c [Paracoccus sp. (in: a-proteobacteria)]|nr:cytochrome c [Paracoccus sp. (in: a-proteobacteria)]